MRGERVKALHTAFALGGRAAAMHLLLDWKWNNEISRQRYVELVRLTAQWHYSKRWQQGVAAADLLDDDGRP